MDEAGWGKCDDAWEMIDALCRRARAKRRRAPQRKFRLFACACCRLLWELLPVDQTRPCVEMAERLADSLVERKEAIRAGRTAHRALGRARAQSTIPAPKKERAGLLAHTAVVWAANTANASEAANWVARLALRAFAVLAGKPEQEERAPRPRRKQVADLLRDVSGNPFRPVALDPAWRTPDVLSLAQAAYEERSLPAGTLEPTRLALLADALEDAGCGNADLLGHLRSGGPHVRGCWAVDLVLGKE